LSLGSNSPVSIWINKDVNNKEKQMQEELAKLFKSLTTLSNLVFIYLVITWGYAGLEFIMRSLFNGSNL
tara:strand:- start:262 stop:468 length:207 start_codon:yes stop_codon:yes gene_type:complete